jgi:transcription antitermination factor NusB
MEAGMSDVSPKPASPKPAPNSTVKRRSARLAAVQYLYQWTLEEKQPAIEAYITAYSERMLEPQDVHEEDGIPLVPAAAPDFALLRKLLKGLDSEHAAIREFLSAQMEAGRPLERTSPLIQSLLEAAAYELVHHESLKPAIILSEYTAIAAGFFDNPELGFINGTLQEVAKTLATAGE